MAIMGGEFQMGSDEGGVREQPIHAVNVPNFELMRAEVTVVQYRPCVIAGACDVPRIGLPGYTWSVDPAGYENHPINGVSWINAQQFASWVGARLPSESEWEFAARSRGQDIRYPWGDEPLDCERLNFFGCDGDDETFTSRICTHPAGHSDQGVCDLLGNVWEWVEDDEHASYNGAPNDGTAWVDTPRGARRINRGGSFFDTSSRTRSTDRSRIGPERSGGDSGMRLARTPR